MPQQLQALQQLGYLQQQQLQQLAQIVPAQLAQLQQLIQVVLQQFQQPQQPLGQIAGLGSYGLATPWGMTSQLFGNQPAQIMFGDLLLLEHGLDRAERVLGSALRLIAAKLPLEPSESALQQIASRTVGVDEIRDRHGTVERGCG